MSDDKIQSEARSRTCKNSGEASCYAFESLEVREVVKSFLYVNGFDGLVDCYGECGCEIDDLMCCDCSGIGCQAAYKKKANHPVETNKSWRMVQAPDSDVKKINDTAEKRRSCFLEWLNGFVA